MQSSVFVQGAPANQTTPGVGWPVSTTVAWQVCRYPMLYSLPSEISHYIHPTKNSFAVSKPDVQPKQGVLVEQGILTRSGGFPPWTTEKPWKTERSSTRKPQTECSTECPFNAINPVPTLPNSEITLLICNSESQHYLGFFFFNGRPLSVMGIVRPVFEDRKVHLRSSDLWESRLEILTSEPRNLTKENLGAKVLDVMGLLWGPKWLHTLIHRQEFFCVIRAPLWVLSVHAPITHTLIVWKLNFQLHAHPLHKIIVSELFV